VSTPLIAHWPAGIPNQRNGKFETQPAHLIDIMPTVAQVAGAKYPERLHGKTLIPMQGVSLLPAFSGKPVGRKEPIFFMHEGNRAVRDGKWKLVSKYTEPWELFDLEADRTELHDLAAERPEIVKRLSGRYDEWARKSYAEPWTGPPRTDWGQELKADPPAKK
jgi:arylsulfatase